MPFAGVARVSLTACVVCSPLPVRMVNTDKIPALFRDAPRLPAAEPSVLVTGASGCNGLPGAAESAVNRFILVTVTLVAMTVIPTLPPIMPTGFVLSFDFIVPLPIPFPAMLMVFPPSDTVCPRSCCIAAMPGTGNEVVLILVPPPDIAPPNCVVPLAL